jgi:hypothetical protein
VRAVTGVRAVTMLMPTSMLTVLLMQPQLLLTLMLMPMSMLTVLLMQTQLLLTLMLMTTVQGSGHP